MKTRSWQGEKGNFSDRLRLSPLVPGAQKQMSLTPLIALIALFRLLTYKPLPMILLGFLSGTALAKECYSMRPIVIDGKEKTRDPVCQVLRQNLNKFCDEPPMICGMRIHPSYRRLLTKPNWTLLDPKKNMDLIESFVRTPWETPPQRRKDTAQDIWSETQLKIEAAMAEKRLHFASAEVDLYNLGEKHLTYHLDFGDCEANNPQLTHPDKRTWYEWPGQGSEQMTAYAPDIAKAIQGRYDSIGVDHLWGEIFEYGGITYFSGWNGYRHRGTGMAENTLWVQRTETHLFDRPGTYLHSTSSCEFVYQPNVQAGETE